MSRVINGGNDVGPLSATYRLLQLRRDMREQEFSEPSKNANSLDELLHPRLQQNEYLQDWVKSVSTNGRSKNPEGDKTFSPTYLNSNLNTGTIRKQARSMLITLCRTMMDYNSEIFIEGTIGITVDRQTVVLLHFDDVVQKISNEHDASVSNHNTTSRYETVDHRNDGESSLKESVSNNYDTNFPTDRNSQSASSNDLKSNPADSREIFVTNECIKLEPTDDYAEPDITNDEQSRTKSFEYDEEFDNASTREEGGESERTCEDDDWTPEGHESEIPLDDEDWAPNVQNKRKTTKFKKHLEYKRGKVSKMTLLRELLLQSTPISNANQCNSDEIGRKLTSASVSKYSNSRLNKKKKKQEDDVQEKNDWSPSQKLSHSAPSPNRNLQASQKHAHVSTPILGSLLTQDVPLNEVYNSLTTSSSYGLPHASLNSRYGEEELTSENDSSFKSSASKFDATSVGRLGQMTLMDLLPRSYHSPTHPPSKLKRTSTTAVEISDSSSAVPDNDSNFMYTRLLHKLVDSRKQDESRAIIVPHVNEAFDALGIGAALHHSEEDWINVPAPNPPDERRRRRKMNKSSSLMQSLLETDSTLNNGSCLLMQSLLESGTSASTNARRDSINNSYCEDTYLPCSEEPGASYNDSPDDHDIVAIKTEASSNEN